jgi:hypothetical protein
LTAINQECGTGNLTRLARRQKGNYRRNISRPTDPTEGDALGKASEEALSLNAIFLA